MKGDISFLKKNMASSMPIRLSKPASGTFPFIRKDLAGFLAQALYVSIQAAHNFSFPVTSLNPHPQGGVVESSGDVGGGRPGPAILVDVDPGPAILVDVDPGPDILVDVDPGPVVLVHVEPGTVFLLEGDIFLPFEHTLALSSFLLNDSSQAATRSMVPQQLVLIQRLQNCNISFLCKHLCKSFLCPLAK